MLLPLLLNNLLEPAEGTDALAADDVESASQVLSPALGQKHGLLANDVSSLSQVSAPTARQIHVLLASDVQSASSVSAPALSTSSEHALLANDVQSLSQVSSAALGQIHVLLATDIQSISIVSRPGIGGTGQESVGGHYWPGKKVHNRYDNDRIKDKRELRELIERAAGLIQEAIEEPSVAPQAKALKVELGKLKKYTREPSTTAKSLELVQAKVDALIAKSVDNLVIQIADVLTDLIQEIAEDE